MDPDIVVVHADNLDQLIREGLQVKCLNMSDGGIQHGKCSSRWRQFDPAHLVGLHISLPQDWVESAGAGGRQRDQVVKQWPQLLFAEPCRQDTVGQLHMALVMMQV